MIKSQKVRKKNLYASIVKARNENVRHSDLFVSTTDPEARVSQKQGKIPALNHLGIISIDTVHHVICGATSDFADKKDSNTTAGIVGQTIENLKENLWKNVLIKSILHTAILAGATQYSRN